MRMPIFYLLLLSLLFSFSSASDTFKRTSFKNSYLQSFSKSVAICARMKNYTFDSMAKDIKKYVEVSPKENFKLQWDYNSLCFKALQPNKSYTITLHKDLPMGKYRLDKHYEFNATTPNYKSILSFPEDGYILPSKGEISLPIKSMNVDKVALYLYRINTRNLMQNIHQYGLFRSIGSYSFENIEERDGYLLWRKEFTLNRTPKNQEALTAIGLDHLLETRQSGVYILYAKIINDQGEEEENYDTKMQWFMLSDIGLYSLQGDEGMHLFTRHLSNAKPYQGIKVELIAKNNEILATAVSDQEGKLFFKDSLLQGKKGLTPKALYAYSSDGDFSVLNLSTSSHDLSDRGVAGRESRGAYEAFIYSNRDIFRPDESITFHALIRDAREVARGNEVLSAKLFDPRGREIYSKQLHSDTSGHLSDTIKLSQSAMQGKWHLYLYRGDKKPIGSYALLVEDFVPPKIKVDLDQNQTAIKLTSRYLNGEIFPNARVELNRIIYRAKSFAPQYKGYHFGNIKSTFSNRYLEPLLYETNEKGELTIPIHIPNDYNTYFPLKASFNLVISELGGRPLHKKITHPFDNNDAYIGIEPLFKNGAIDIDQKASFNLIYLENQKPTKQTLHYRIIKEQVHWNWRSVGESWEYFKKYSDDSTLKEGTFITKEGLPQQLALEKLDWGSYRLEIFDEDKIAFSSYRFTSGYEPSSSKASPDRLPIAIDKQHYQDGERLRVRINAKFTGSAMVNIAHHAIVATQMVDVVAGQSSELSFKVDKNWGSSLYVLATAFKAQSQELSANRAIGVVPFKIVDPQREIALEITHAPKTTANNPLHLHIQSKKPLTSPTFVTLALVDEGVHQLTNYKAPSASEYFFGQQKLGIEIRDIYGSLIKVQGVRGRFNVGAGDDMQSLSPKQKSIRNQREVVALFKGPLALNQAGFVDINLSIPNYQGNLKIMAIAWNQEGVGESESSVVVQDPLAIEYYMPAFLAQGDQATTLIEFKFDKNQQKGLYRVDIKTNKGVEVSKEHFELNLTQNQRTLLQEVTISTEHNEDVNMTIHVTTPSGKEYQNSFKLAVRPPYPLNYVRHLTQLDPSQTIKSSNLVNPMLWSHLSDITLYLSNRPQLSLDSFEEELINYRGRCMEQTTSRAMPWLFDSNLTDEKRDTIQRAIDRLLRYQHISGGFALWQGGDLQLWLSSYVVDFLTRAKKQGFKVPTTHIQKGLDFLQNNLNRWESQLHLKEANIYALYTLTRSGRILLSQIKHHAKTSMRLSSASWGYLGASFAYLNETTLAKESFAKATSSLNIASNSYQNYGGLLRNHALLISLMHEANIDKRWLRLYPDLVKHVKERKYLSTQELSQILRTALLINEEQHPLDELALLVNHQPLLSVTGEYQERFDSLDRFPPITNQNTQPIWVDLNFVATANPQHYNPKENRGFTLSKRIFNMEGEEINLGDIKQNDRILVAIEGEITHYGVKHPLITDLLPTGFEIENPHIMGRVHEQGVTLTSDAYRIDRFEASFDSSTLKKGRFWVSYIARAVTKGSFTLSPAKIEDMYQPEYRALSNFVQQKIEIKDQKSTTPNKPTTPDTLTKEDYTIAQSKHLGSLAYYSIVELHVLRNAIFALHGLDFSQSNPMLHKRFLPYKWYTPSTEDSQGIYQKLSHIQKSNVHKLLEEEKLRGGGLVLADFYRVNTLTLDEKMLKKYTKKELKILRNSLFARYGLAFKDAELRKIYSFMPWYNPKDITVSEIFDEQMSQREKDNIHLMIKIEKSL
jgi:uncharacterized protein YfaS (alpha-2-macroglobulin family)